MTDFSAVVIFTIELCVANLSTNEASVVQIVDCAWNSLFLFPAMATVLQSVLAFGTQIGVTFLLTSVDSTVQRSSARGIANNFILLAALHRFGGPSAAAASVYHRLTRWTWPRMTELDTSVLAKLFPAAKLPAGMSHVASIILRILFLSAEAIVLPWNLLRHILARRTAPPLVGFRTTCPLGRTSQMQNMVAIRTGPNGLGRPHQIATNQTLQLAGI